MANNNQNGRSSQDGRHASWRPQDQSTEQYGQGQSGYGSGRVQGDRAYNTRNQSSGGGQQDRSRGHGNLDDRWSGRGNDGFEERGRDRTAGGDRYGDDHDSGDANAYNSGYNQGGMGYGGHDDGMPRDAGFRGHDDSQGRIGGQDRGPTDGSYGARPDPRMEHGFERERGMESRQYRGMGGGQYGDRAMSRGQYGGAQAAMRGGQYDNYGHYNQGTDQHAMRGDQMRGETGGRGGQQGRTGYGAGSGYNEGGQGGAARNATGRGSPDDMRYSQGHQGMGHTQGQGFGQSGGQYGQQRERVSHHGKGPAGWQRSDDRIKDMVCELLHDDHDVDATHIQVSVSGGEVTLTGTVPDRHMKRAAEDVAHHASGVKDVHNQLRVQR